MPNNTWKALERKTARALNGKRNIDRAGDYHLSRLVVIRLADFQDLFGDIKGV